MRARACVREARPRVRARVRSRKRARTLELALEILELRLPYHTRYCSFLLAPVRPCIIPLHGRVYFVSINYI